MRSISRLALSRNRVRPIVLASLAALFLAVGCGDPFGLDPRDIVGVNGLYHASTFMIDDQDVLAEGGTLRMTLHPQGDVSGCVLIPDGPATACAQDDARLSGFWEFIEDDNVILLTLTREVFLADLTYAWAPRRLEANEVLDGVSYHIVLDQQGD